MRLDNKIINLPKELEKEMNESIYASIKQKEK